MNDNLVAAEFTLPSPYPTDRRGPVRWIISHAVRHWQLALTMIVGAVGNAALAAAVPVYIGMAFNVILESPPRTGALLPLAVGIGGTQLLRGLLQFGRNFGAEVIAQRIERDIRAELYLSLLGKSMTFHNLQPIGDLMARATNDVREVNFLFSPGLNLVIGSANFLLMPLVFAPRYHPQLMLTPALFIIGYFLALWQYLHELEPITSGVRQSFGRMNTRLAEAIDGIETVKGMAQEESEVGRFEHYAHRFRDAYIFAREMWRRATFLCCCLAWRKQAVCCML